MYVSKRKSKGSLMLYDEYRLGCCQQFYLGALKQRLVAESVTSSANTSL